MALQHRNLGISLLISIIPNFLMAFIKKCACVKIKTTYLFIPQIMANNILIMSLVSNFNENQAKS